MHGEAGEGGGRVMGARGDGGKGEEERFLKGERGEMFLKEADVSLAMSSRVDKRSVSLFWDFPSANIVNVMIKNGG